jgi:hypothetical protein
MSHVHKPDRRPAQPSAEMPIVERSGALHQALVRWPPPFHTLLDTASHRLRPLLPLGVWHP